MFRRRGTTADLGELQLSTSEEQALRQWLGQGSSHTIDDVWALIGRDPDRGCAIPSAVRGLTGDGLLHALLAQAGAEHRGERGPAASRPVRRFVQRYGVELAAGVLALAVAASAVRAAGATLGLWEWGLVPQTLAAHTLPAGHIVRADDLLVGRLPTTAGRVAEPFRAIGLRTATTVNAGQALSINRLERLQLVATRALLPYQPLQERDVTLQWSAPSRGALTHSSALTGFCLREAVAPSTVIQRSHLLPCPRPRP